MGRVPTYVRQGLSAARRGYERVRDRSVCRGAILMYHRVAQQKTDPWKTAVSPENFAGHMEVLRRRGDASRLTEVTTALAANRYRTGQIAVTFDDGYLDTLVTALPILEATTIPATVFVPSGLVGDPDGFWWETVRRTILETPRLPEMLTLEAGRRRATWDLGGAAITGGSAGQAPWSADEQAPRSRRETVFLEVWQFLLALDPVARREARQALEDWAGPVAPGFEATCRPVDTDELRRLAASPLIDIGGHARTHPDLGALCPEAAAVEIREDRDALIEMTGQRIETFGYPFGRFGPETPRTVREVGYTAACNSRPAVASSRDDHFLLPRIQVPDMAGPEFAALLDRLLGPTEARGDAARPSQRQPL